MTIGIAKPLLLVLLGPGKKTLHIDNKEAARIYAERYRKNNPAQVKKNQRKYRKNNPEKVLESARNFRERNRETLRVADAQRKRLRYKEDQEYRDELKERRRNRYATDPEYRETIKAKRRERYQKEKLSGVVVR